MKRKSWIKKSQGEDDKKIPEETFRRKKKDTALASILENHFDSGLRSLAIKKVTDCSTEVMILHSNTYTHTCTASRRNHQVAWKLASIPQQNKSEDATMGKDGNESYTTTISTIQLNKPMGILLEEINEFDPTAGGGGVWIAQIGPNGSTAVASSNLNICVRDRILAINGQECATLDFDSVKARIG